MLNRRGRRKQRGEGEESREESRKQREE